MQSPNEIKSRRDAGGYFHKRNGPNHQGAHSIKVKNKINLLNSNTIDKKQMS